MEQWGFCFCFGGGTCYCYDTTFPYFIPMKRRKMSSFPNTNSLVGYERFVLFCFVFCQILVWICGQYFLCTRLLNRLEASCGHWMAHMNFGDQLRHLLTECPYCIFMAVSLAQHLVWPMLSCRVFPAPSVDVNLCLKIQKK